ncbi:hypothetical protein [Renibacterium salmoninarum]|nr:hypothetical protein [Renibacterium salmoninarum]
MNTLNLRLLRGWSAASFATLTAACSHTVGGGSFPFGIAFLLALTLSALVCTVLAGKKISLPRLILAVVGSQLIFHRLFALLGDASFGSAASTPSGHHHRPFALPGLSTADLSSATSGAEQLMLFAHLAAGILTVAAFRRGESAILQLINAIKLMLRPLLIIAMALLPAHQERPRLAPHTRLAAFSSREVFLRQHHRGPPAATAYVF